MTRAASAYAFALTMSVWTNEGRATELQYEAPQECPPSEEVERRLDEGGRARNVRVSIGRAGPVYVGEVRAGDDDEDRLERRVEGATCRGVVDALVVIASLHAPAAEEPIATEDADPGPARREPLVARSRAPLEDGEDRPENAHRAQPRSAVELAIGHGGQVRSLDGTDVAVFTVVAEVGAPRAFGLDRYRPSLRAAGLYAIGLTTRLAGVGIDACPLGLAFVSTRTIDLTASACGAMNLGEATDTAWLIPKHGESQLWADAGALARLTLQMGSKRRFRGFVSADGGAVLRVGRALPGSRASDAGDAMPTFGLVGGFMLP